MSTTTMSATTMSASALSLKAPATCRMRASRRLFSIFGWGATGFCLGLLVALMLWILAVVFLRGIGAMSLSLLTTITQGNGGGLLNAIEGTAVLSVGAMLMAVPL